MSQIEMNDPIVCVVSDGPQVERLWHLLLDEDNNLYERHTHSTATTIRQCARRLRVCLGSWVIETF